MEDQERGEKINKIEYYLRNKKLPPEVRRLHPSNQYRFMNQCAEYQMKDGKIINKETGYELIRPERREEAVIQEFKQVPMGAKAIAERMKGSGLTKHEIEETLHTLIPDQLHRQLPPKRVIKHITAQRYGERFQADLVDMSKYGWHNQGYNWMLTVIDIYSRRAWAFKLKRKESNQVIEAIRPLLISERVKLLHTDNGSEFTSNEFKAMCQSLKVKQIFGPPYSPHSQGHIERFNRTIKSMLFKYFTWNQTKIWIDVLDKFVDRYNNTTHSATLMKPITKEAKREFRPIHLDPIPPNKKHEVGEIVRLALRQNPNYRKKIFEKKYTVQWTKDTYQITNTKGDMYRVKNVKDPSIRKWISQNDLQVIKGEVEVKPDPRVGREAHLERLHVPLAQMRESEHRPPEETLLESRAKNPRVRRPNVRLKDL